MEKCVIKRSLLKPKWKKKVFAIIISSKYLKTKGKFRNYCAFILKTRFFAVARSRFG